MMREDVQRDWKFPGDDAIDERARAAGAEIDHFLGGELAEILGGFFFAARQADGREKQGRAGGRADAPGELALPARIEQFVIALRHLVGRHQTRVVGDAVVADARARPVAARIAVTFGHGIDHGREVRLRQLGFDRHLADSCAFHEIGHEVAGAHLGRDLGNDLLGVAAPEGHLHEWIFLHEGLRQRALRLIDDGCGVKNDLPLLLGAVQDRLCAICRAAQEDVLRAGGDGRHPQEGCRNQDYRALCQRLADQAVVRQRIHAASPCASRLALPQEPGAKVTESRRIGHSLRWP
jgi:hypothetical protein